MLLNGGQPLLANEGCQWQNLLGCDNWVLPGSPKLKMVGFRDLVGVDIGPVSKKLDNELTHNTLPTAKILGHLI